MEQTFEAVYENGVPTPLEPLDLPDHQRLKVTIRVLSSESPDEALRAWQKVYEGFSDVEIEEIERRALDRLLISDPGRPTSSIFLQPVSAFLAVV
jgi:predicted DNA-binding antitoxin AbrB/MazE fold protein